MNGLLMSISVSATSSTSGILASTKLGCLSSITSRLARMARCSPWIWRCIGIVDWALVMARSRTFIAETAFL